MKQISFNLKNLLLAVACLMSTLTASGGTTGTASFTMTSSVTTTPGAVVEIPIKMTSDKAIEKELVLNFTLSANLTLVDADGTPLSGTNEALLGDRSPEYSTVLVGKQGVKTINGAEYNVYLVIGYNFSGYHLSGSTYNYQHYGAMHKDDAPLLGFYIKNTDMSAKNGPVADIYIANTEFSIRECITANWDANDRRFFYCTGGNNESQRYQRYVPVKVRYQ